MAAALNLIVNLPQEETLVLPMPAKNPEDLLIEVRECECPASVSVGADASLRQATAVRRDVF